MQHIKHLAIKGLLLVISCAATLPAAAQTTTTWTGGAGDNDWSSPDNWNNGLPGAANGAVFPVTLGTETDVEIVLPGNYEAQSFTFLGTTDAGVTPVNYKLTTDTGDRYTTIGTGGIQVNEGSGAHEFYVGTKPDGPWYRLYGGETTPVVNNSANALTIQGKFYNVSGVPALSFGGSGDIVFRGGGGGTITTSPGIRLEVGNVYLPTSMTGRVVVEEGVFFWNQGGRYIQGGTLVMDGNWNMRAAGTAFWVAGEGVQSVLTGNGDIGIMATLSAYMDIQIRDKAVVDPGRVGETSTIAANALTFHDSDVTFQAGSALRLDLKDLDEHDRLLFMRTEPYREPNAGEINPKIPDLTLAGDGAGVGLELNFLGEPVEGQYTILSGYDNIYGEFSGWEDGVGRSLDGYDGYTFTLDYGASATTLTVIPEPHALALLAGALGILMLARRREARCRISREESHAE